GFFHMPEEPLPDIFFLIQSPEGLCPVMFWDYAFIGKQPIDFKAKEGREHVPSYEECIWIKRLQQEDIPDGYWRSRGIIRRRPRTDAIQKHQHLLGQLLAIKSETFVELTVQFNDTQTESVLLFTSAAIRYIHHDRVQHIPFEET